MEHRGTPLQRLGLIACAVWVASGCDDGAAPSAAAQDAAQAQADAAQPQGDAAQVQPDAAAHEEDASESEASVSNGARDRCLEGSCAPPALPAQTPYEFLSETEGGWLRLIQADWELAAKSEGYRCVRKTMPEDVYITGFAPLNPPGTHHTTLHVESGGQPDGVTICGVGAGGTRRLQGAGVGTEPAMLPAGVAMKVAAGEQLMMNLHLFNFGDQPLSGTSGMRVMRVPPAQVTHQAEVVLVGPLALSIPPGRVTQSGRCTLRSPVTIFSLNPHMHQLGRHMKVTVQAGSGSERVLHDQPYDFTHQLLHPIEPVQLATGDSVNIECTYENQTVREVRWGDSSLDEMCFVGVGLYPALGAGGFPCSN